MEKEITLHTIRSSSRGNATIVDGGETKILVDCGISGKTLEEALRDTKTEAKSISAIVVTHEHTDHIKGIGIVSRKYNIPIYANKETWTAMGSSIGRLDAVNMRVFRTGTDFSVGQINVRAFGIPHDAAEPVGYIFETQGDKVAVATDMGEIWDSVYDEIKGSREILLEANYNPGMLEMGPYPYELKRRIKGRLGHLCNEDAAYVAVRLAESGTKRIILGHLSMENNRPDIAYITVRNALEENGVDLSADFCLSVAHREMCGDAQPFVI